MALLQKSPDKLITGEELLRMPDLGPCELVDGRIVPMTPPGDEHSDIEAELVTRLRLYGKESKRGRAVSGDAGIYIRRNPDTVRGADVLFISKERDSQPRKKGYFKVAPELVVEVLSPDHRPGQLREKLRDYFSVDVKVVWVVDPKARCVFVYRSLTDITELGVGQALADEELLPGFSLPVSDLFSG